MTFYNEKMVKNVNLMKAWRAAHDIKLEDGDTRLPDVCEEIESHLRRHRHPCSRLSLRTTSELLTGASRIYLDQADLLMRDAFKLAYGPTAAPLAIGKSSENFNSSASSNNKTESTIDDDDKSNSMSSPSTDSSIVDEPEASHDDLDDVTEKSVTEESTVFTALTEDEHNDPSVPSTPQTKDQAVQTEGNPTEENILGEDLDPTLPFGHILIYNSLRSRVPSVFMFSSLNEKVKNIISLLSNKK